MNERVYRETEVSNVRFLCTKCRKRVLKEDECPVCDADAEPHEQLPAGTDRMDDR